MGRGIADRLRRLGAAFDRLGWVVLVIASLMCAYAVVATMLIDAPIGRTFADWATYVRTVDRMLSGGPIYPPEQLSGSYVLVGVTLIGYAYPPSSVPLFIPFTSYPIGLLAWLVLSAGLLLSGSYAIMKRELGHVPPLAFAVVLFGFTFLRGFSEGLAFGNASVPMAGLFAWAWVIGRGRDPIGLVAGLGGTIKLVPGTLVFWATPRTIPRVLLITIAVGLGLAAVTLPLVGMDAWADYLKAMSLSEPACAVDSTPVSIACMLKPTLGIAGAKLAGIVVALAAGGLAVASRSPLVAYGLVAVAWLAPVTDLHFHYYLVVYVVLIAAFATWLRRRKEAATGRAIAA